MENQDEMDFVEEVEEVIPHETPEEKFLRLVNKRLPVAVKRIRLLKNLAGPTYKYSDKQAGAVVAVLRTELEELERAFFSSHDDDDVPVIE
jgi:hypothetical protein